MKTLHRDGPLFGRSIPIPARHMHRIVCRCEIFLEFSRRSVLPRKDDLKKFAVLQSKDLMRQYRGGIFCDELIVHRYIEPVRIQNVFPPPWPRSIKWSLFVDLKEGGPHETPN